MSVALPSDWTERVYAGVLGKILGVYLGRPVEGWPYAMIREQFGELEYYVNGRMGIPIVTADDDISGSFGFGRTVLDHSDRLPLQPHHVGETWLDYIIEDRTILWWGGRGRSTEHTAFLNLKRGVPAPQSGSIELNGTTLPAQVGAQIFIDAIAMAHPADPAAAARAVRAAASVSHDGVAVDAAAFIGAMEALAFVEPSLPVLIDSCIHEVGDPELRRVIADVVSLCADESDWRAVRESIDERYGYHRYVGPCSVITNHAAVLASLLLGGDDFARSLTIAASAGWDTDSNAGVVGALNGIRLGLEALTNTVDLRTAVADRMLVVTSDGGECVTDAVREARSIVRAAQVVRGDDVEPRHPRFDFRFLGSRQGFEPCPVVQGDGMARVLGAEPATGLVVEIDGAGPGVRTAVSTPTFLDELGESDHFSTLASPTLYPGQTVRARMSSSVPMRVTPYVALAASPGSPISTGDPTELSSESVELVWEVPDAGAAPLRRFGFLVEPPAGSRASVTGQLRIEEIDWVGAPREHATSGVLLSDIWDLHPAAMRGWVSSARHFEADFRVSYSVSHPEGRGVATIGTRDWDDYSFASTLVFNPHAACGIVVRARGHRTYLAAEFSGWDRLRLVQVRHGVRRVLAETPYAYFEDIPARVEVTCSGSEVQVSVDSEMLLSATADGQLPGGAGFFAEDGTMLADGYRVHTTHTKGNA